MFRYGARTFVTSARRLAEPSAHTIGVSKAQGIARGLTEGMIFHSLYPILSLFTVKRATRADAPFHQRLVIHLSSVLTRSPSGPVAKSWARPSS